ncbi:phage tail spike protein [Liquorilactobacillus hordei]|uniref:phage tail spike protein n=1 Tax=Liquorilactobacillus hordei TaxID=468911 RepID=UPI0039E9224B
MSVPVLYEANATDFFNKGLGTLPDALTAVVTEERNGEFIFEMTYPADGARADLLENNRIIKVDAGHALTDQRFVIKKVTPQMTEEGKIYIDVYAEHISYITNDLALKPSVTVNGSANDAMQQWQKAIVGSNGIVADSDISTNNSTTWTIDKVQNARLALGGVDGSILDVWGGEYLFDNLHISLKKQRGSYANTLLAYGRNITSFQQEENIESTYTSIYPYATLSSANGDTSSLYSLDEYFVDSQYVDNYPNRKILPVDFSSSFESVKVGTKPSDASDSDTTVYMAVAEVQSHLKDLAQQYITNNDVGIPTVSISVSFVDLSRTSNYADVAPLEQLDLCDIVPIRFTKLGIDTTAKVTHVEWNVLTDSYEKIELGSITPTLGQTLSTLTTVAQTAKQAAQDAQNNAIIAWKSAGGKTTTFQGSSSQSFPTAQKIGDQYYRENGDDTEFYIWDGAEWKFIMSNKTGQNISNAIDTAMADVDTAKQDAQTAVDTANTSIAQSGLAIDTATTAKQVADSANSVATQAKTDSASALSNAQTAMTDAKNSLSISNDNADKITSLDSDIDTVNKNLSDTKTDLQKSITDNTNKIKDVSSGLDSTKTDLQKKIDNNSSTISKAQSDISTVSNDLNTTKTNLKTVSDLATQNKTDINTTNSTVSGIKTDLANTKGDVTELKTTASGLETDVTNAQGDITKLQTRAGSLESNMSDAQGDISSLQQTASGFNTTLTSLQSDNTTNKSNIASLQSTSTSMSSNIASLQSDNKTNKSDISTLKQTATSLESDISSVQTTANSNKSDISSLQQDSTGIKANVASLQSDNTTNKSNISSLQITANGLNNSVSSIQNQVNASAVGTNLIRDTHSDWVTIKPFTDWYYSDWTSTLVSDVGLKDGDIITCSKELDNTLADTNVLRNHIRIKDKDENIIFDQDSDYVQSIPGETSKAIQTLTLPVGSYVIRMVTIQSQINNPVTGLRIRHEKIEKGSVATDYSTNPADNATVTSVSTLSNTVSGLNSTVSKVQTTADANKTNISSLSNTVNGLNSTVSSLSSDNTTNKSNISSLQITANGIQTNVSSLQSDNTTNKSNISSLQQTATEIKSSLSSKVDNSTYTSDKTQTAKDIASKVSQTDFNSLKGTVSTQGTNIDQNTHDITLKANTTTVNTLAGRVSTAESNIDINAQAITQKVSSNDVQNILDTKGYATQTWTNSAITQKADEINSTVTTLQNQVNNSAVGTNLMRDTHSDWVTIKPFTDWYYSDWTSTLVSDVGLKDGDIITCSKELDNTLADTNVLRNHIRIKDKDENIIFDQDSDYVQSIPGETSKAIQTLTLPVGSYVIRMVTIQSQINNPVTGLRIRHEKIEKGSVATDYSTNPADNATVTALSIISQKADSISQTVTDNKSASDAQFTNIHQTISGIQSTVANKADSSTVTQLANTWQANLTTLQTQVTNSAVGTNLLLGTSSTKTTGTTNVWGQYTNRDITSLVSAGKTYTYQVNVYSAAHAGRLRVNFVDSSGTNTYTDGAQTPYGYTGNLILTFTVPSNAVKVILNDYTWNSSATATTYTFDSEKLEKGSVATDWSANPADNATTVALTAVNTSLTSAINLRVKKDDVINQINVSSEGILIDGAKVHITGTTTIDNAVIKSAMIDSLSASKLTAGTIDASVISVINLNANNISTGTITGSNLSINLTTGTVLFRKGSIKSSGGTLDIEIDNGTMAVTDSSGRGFKTESGQLNFYDGISSGSLIKYGSLSIDWTNGDGLEIFGNKGITLGTGVGTFSDTSLNIFSKSQTGGSKIVIDADELDMFGTSSTTAKNFYIWSTNWSISDASSNTIKNYAGTAFWESASGLHLSTDTSDISLRASVGNVNLTSGSNSSITLNGASINYKADTWYSGSTDWWFRSLTGSMATIHVDSVSTTSILSAKTNISKLDGMYALTVLSNTDIYNYNYKSDVENGVTKVYASPIIDDVNDKPRYRTPFNFISHDGTGRDDGTILGYAIAAIQELNKQISDLQSQIKNLKEIA